MLPHLLLRVQITINNLATHTVVDGLVSLGMFCLGTRKITGMPTGGRLLVALAF